MKLTILIILPWEEIKAEVERAAMRIARSRMLSIRDLATHIIENQGDYPAIMKPRDGSRKPTTPRTLYNRIHIAVNGSKETTGLLWPKWSAGRANSRNGAIFILPWKQEDPAVVQAKEEIASEI